MNLRLLPVILASGTLLCGFAFSGFTTTSPIARQAETTLESVQLDGTREAAEERLIVKLSKPVAPRLRFVASEECWQVDLPNVAHRGEPVALAGTGGNLRLVRSATVGQDPVVTRLSLFVRPGTGVKVKTQNAGFDLNLTSGEQPDSPGHEAAGRHLSALPNGLLAPVQIKEEVVISLDRSAPLPLLGELARRAGIEPRFRDAPPKNISCRGSAANPIAALHLLAKSMDMVLVDEGDAWRFSRRSNPLLKVPSEENIDGGELEGETLRAVLIRLAGQDFGEAWARRLGECAGRPLRGVAGERLSMRSWVERILKAHGIDPNGEYRHG